MSTKARFTITKWNYDPRGNGCAGAYERYGWNVFSDGYWWVIRRPDGFVYSRGYKQLRYAIQFADRKISGALS